MQPTRQQLTATLGDALREVSQLLVGLQADAWIALDLTVAQARVLYLLNQSPQRMSQIAAHAGCSLSSATSMMDRLVGKELVERLPDQRDRRVVWCHLTAKGQAVLEELWQVRMRYVERAVAQLDRNDLRQIASALRTLAISMRKLTRREPTADL
jgi:DNA-binding MarR family transcriptional regulator